MMVIDKFDKSITWKERVILQKLQIETLFWK